MVALLPSRRIVGWDDGLQTPFLGHRLPVTDKYSTKESIRLPEYTRTVVLLQTLEFEGLVAQP